MCPSGKTPVSRFIYPELLSKTENREQNSDSQNNGKPKQRALTLHSPAKRVFSADLSGVLRDVPDNAPYVRVRKKSHER